MKIDALPGFDAAPPRSALAQQAALWRQALEMAQWQGRQRAVPQPLPSAARFAAQSEGEPSALAVRSTSWLAQPATILHGPAAAASADPSAAPAQPAAGSAVPSSSDPAPAQPLIAGPPAQALAQASALPITAHMPAPVVAPAPAVATVPAQDPASATAAPPRMALPPATATPWPLVASQASLRGTSVSASLRDARLDAGQAQTLRRALSRQLAADGLQLAEFRINGLPIDP